MKKGEMTMRRRCHPCHHYCCLSGWIHVLLVFLPQLGVARPMANMAYFYYGKSHAKSDSALYVAYFPLYCYEMRTKGHSRDMVFIGPTEKGYGFYGRRVGEYVPEALNFLPPNGED